MRSVMTLLLGSGLAQLGPLVFGPVLSRLYGPESFGLFHLASAVGSNVAVVACARYEFALPMAADEREARALRELCVRVLITVSGVCLMGAIGAAWWWQILWPLAVPALVATAGALSLWTLEATRQQRFPVLATARVLQFWGCGAVQALCGLLQAGVWGLLIGPVLAAGAAALALWRSVRGAYPENTAERDRGETGSLAPRPERESSWITAARQHRDFPLLNTPHAFFGALQDTLSIAMIAATAGPAAAGVWGVALRYLKAPATLAGGAVSQVLYPSLSRSAPEEAQADLRRVMRLLLAAGAALGLLLYAFSGWALPALLGPGWEKSGAMGQGLALYIALHFVASPLGVVTLAWRAQAWALRASLVGQLVFAAALLVGLLGPWEGEPLTSAAWAVSLAMAPFFGWYFWRLWHGPLQGKQADAAPARDAGSSSPSRDNLHS